LGTQKRIGATLSPNAPVATGPRQALQNQDSGEQQENKKLKSRVVPFL